VVRRAPSDYLFIRGFRRLRARMMSHAHALDGFTDEDVFEQVEADSRHVRRRRYLPAK
jgi:hypothetical protein